MSFGAILGFVAYTALCLVALIHTIKVRKEGLYDKK